MRLICVFSAKSWLPAMAIAALVIALCGTGYSLQDKDKDKDEKAAAPVAAQPETKAPAAASEKPSPPPLNAISLSPAVIITRGQPDQSATQTLTLSNQTKMPFSFEMMAQDIVVRDGKRVFVNAGELTKSIAATAVFSKPGVTVLPGQSASVDVTVTLVPDTELRAIAAIFHGTDKLSGQINTVGMTASLGCLITFTASNNFDVSTSALQITSPTETLPLKVSLELTNTGSEPVIPEGVVALLSEAGKLVGKVPFNAQRLLPGERLPFAAEYAGQLHAGKYRAVASFQFEDKTISNTADFTIE
jgi:hypothetical protein